jgi:hypothetical protein
MGDMADWCIDIAESQLLDWHLDIQEYLALPDAQLVAMTSAARLPLVVSIRRWFRRNNRLSERQRYVLAR